MLLFLKKKKQKDFYFPALRPGARRPISIRLGSSSAKNKSFFASFFSKKEDSSLHTLALAIPISTFTIAEVWKGFCNVGRSR
jgi:hypothetical protein